METTQTKPIKPVIRICRGYSGIYLYKLQNRGFWPLNWHLSYWVLNVDYIFEHIKTD